MEEEAYLQEPMGSKEHSVEQIIQEGSEEPDQKIGSDEATETGEVRCEPLDDAWQLSCGELKPTSQPPGNVEGLAMELSVAADTAEDKINAATQSANAVDLIDRDQQKHSSIEHSSSSVVHEISNFDSRSEKGSMDACSDYKSDEATSVTLSERDSVLESTGSLSNSNSTLDKDASSTASEDVAKDIQFELSHWPRSSKQGQSFRRVKVRSIPVNRSTSLDANIHSRYVASMERHIKQLKGSQSHILYSFR